jgi:hypothetical protein
MDLDAPPLRAVIPPVVLLTLTIVLPKEHFVPSPSKTIGPTYHNNTGTQDAQYHYTQHTKPGQPLSTSATPHPRQSKQQTPVPVSTHNYDTPSKSKALTPIATVTMDSDTLAYALLGNAIRSDTGTIAEYKELSQGSESPLCQTSNAEEIGCLTHGFGE